MARVEFVEVESRVEFVVSQVEFVDSRVEFVVPQAEFVDTRVEFVALQVLGVVDS